MSKKGAMTVTVMKRFEEMIDAQFESLQAEASALDTVQKRKVEISVKKELGIYELYIALIKHETAVKEIKAKLEEWENNQYRKPTGKWQSQIDHLVEIRLGGDDALPSTKIKRAKQKLKDEILFCSMPDEVKAIIEKIPAIVADIQKTLPKVSQKELMVAQINAEE